MAPELLNANDQNNQTTNNGIVALDCKSDDFKTGKDDNEVNNASRQNDLVSSEKYNKLKRKFSVLREVRTCSKHKFIGILTNYQWLGRLKSQARKSHTRKSVSVRFNLIFADSLEENFSTSSRANTRCPKYQTKT